MTKLKEPESMSECVYFTNRTIGQGKIKAWVFREECPKCKKTLMGKPINPKTGKAKTRSDEYECPKCKYSEEKKEYEDKLTINIQYTCPNCNHQSELQKPFLRKKVQRFNEEKQKKESVNAIRFPCEKCNANIDLTHKLK